MTTSPVRDLADAFVVLAIQSLFLLTFVLAALVKWSEPVPSWFLQQFQNTWLAGLPFGLPGVYTTLACIESVAAIGFAASLVSGEAFRSRRWLLRASLIYSLFVFIVLAYGSRLTGKFDIAGWNFLYFLGALVALRAACADLGPIRRHSTDLTSSNTSATAPASPSP